MGGWVTAMARDTRPAPPTGPCDGEPCPDERFEGPCPADMVLIAGGLYKLGLADSMVAPYALDAGDVSVAAFCMAKYEHPGVLGALPTVEVSQREAALLCQDRGRRLCRDIEWEAACRGQSGRTYSYGNTKDDSRCHTESSALEAGGALRPIGSFERCVSVEGVFDLNGSVSEHVSDTHPGPPFPPDVDSAAGESGILRGGTMWGAAYGQDCLSRHWHLPDHRQEDDGFRCCRDAQVEQPPVKGSSE